MKQIPILYSTPMVQAILQRKKTETRRTRGLGEINKRPDAFRYDGVNSEGEHMFFDVHGQITGHDPQDCIIRIKSPYGQKGNLLWGRETWAKGVTPDGLHPCEVYKVSHDGTRVFTDEYQWKPSIHMPKRIARIWTMNESVHLERLREITEEGALAEGCISTAVLTENGNDYTGFYATEHYQQLWDSLNGEGEFYRNPWVWVIKFKVQNEADHATL